MQIVKKIFEVTKPYWPRVILGIVFGLMVSGIAGVKGLEKKAKE
jgi:hypothetical protein